MERERKPSQLNTRRKPRIYWEGLREGQPVVIKPRKPRMYFGKPRITWEAPRKKPRIYWETGKKAA